MAAEFSFREEEFLVDEGVGYPKAYAKLCRYRGAGPYAHGPPFTFTPYALQQNENARARELEQLFPVIDPKAKQTANPKIFVSLLWKQLSHLGNSGFDPAVIRVGTYGNVLYFHADKASPLAWDIDHWFPCQRGGFTVPSNLRILQWQVCKRKHNKLEFVVPWWDFQLGVSVNQFLSIFASSNSDFRHRAFSFLFSEGENEEINASQTVESHSFPQHFYESKDQIGLAAAALVVSRRESYDTSMALRSLDYNRQIRPHSPVIAARKVKPIDMKENVNLDFALNPYQAIVVARDSLKQREESQKMQAEIQKLDDEVHEMRRKNDEEKIAIQDLEMTLIKRRRRVEKCRRLAEAQSSYRTMLEKMIRDAMHQSVIYKEQARLSQAATTALMARLEAQKEICDNAEKELHKKLKQGDEIEQQIRPEWEHVRKRSRIDYNFSLEDGDRNDLLYLTGTRPRTSLHKELRVFLEEEQKASEETEHEEIEESKNPADDNNREELIAVASENESLIEDKLRGLNIGKGDRIQFPIIREGEIEENEEDEESRKQRGKGNVERWLQLLLDNSQYDEEPEISNDIEKSNRTDDIIAKLNQKFPQKDDKRVTLKVEEIENGKEKEKGLARTESARLLSRIPSSPLILGMRKGVDCIRKKAVVTDDNDYC